MNNLPSRLSNPFQPFPIQIGREIRYVLSNGEIRAAWISKVLDHVDGVIDCHVMIDPTADPVVNVHHQSGALQIARSARYSARCNEVNSWHWPNNTPPLAEQKPPQVEATPMQPIISQQPCPDTATIEVSPEFVDDGIMTSGFIQSMPDSVQAIMSLANERQDTFYPTHAPRAFVWMPIQDHQFPGIDWLDAAVDTIAAWRSHGWTVLVHCSDGQSRAGLVDVAYHMKSCGWNRDQALSMVRAKRSATNPNPFFLVGLTEYAIWLQETKNPPKQAIAVESNPTMLAQPPVQHIQPAAQNVPGLMANRFPQVSR